MTAIPNSGLSTGAALELDRFIDADLRGCAGDFKFSNAALIELHEKGYIGLDDKTFAVQLAVDERWLRQIFPAYDEYEERLSVLRRIHEIGGVLVKDADYENDGSIRVDFFDKAQRYHRNMVPWVQISSYRTVLRISGAHVLPKHIAEFSAAVDCAARFIQAWELDRKS